MKKQLGIVQGKIYLPLTLLLIAGVFCLSISLAVRNGLSRDENVFIAGAHLIADQSLLPYRDFQFMHLPNLILVYALLIKLANYDLLITRLFSALCATGIAILVFLISFRFFEHSPALRRYGFAWESMLFLASNPLFIFTSGYAWNYNLSAFLAMAALAMHLWSTRRSRPILWLLLSGMLLGLSVGTRVSFMTVVPAFAAALFFHPKASDLREAFKLLLAFGAGLLISLLPVGYLFLLAPKSFIFSNYTYHLLNTSYRLDVNYEGPITLVERLDYFLKSVLGQQGNLLLFLSLIFFGYTASIIHLRKKSDGIFEPVLILSAIPFATLGSFLAAPSWYQYFYAAVPFALCAVAYGLSRIDREEDRTARWLRLLFLYTVLLSSLFQYQEFRRVTFLLHPEAWRPLIYHQLSLKIKEALGEGKVLTLTPVIPLEGNLTIYPELSTGPFIWRLSDALDDEERGSLNVINEEDLEGFLSQDPPKGILVGLEASQEQALNDYAVRHGYQNLPVSETFNLWVRSTPVGSINPSP